MKDKTGYVFLAVFLIFFAGLASAQATDPLSSNLQTINNIIYAIATALAALMIMIHGIKFLLADSPQGRKDAKDGIIYVIAALIVIVLATVLVETIYVQICNYVYGPGTCAMP
jgi:succinate dehydrogenase hydrophobic anchor subunit